MSSHEHAFIIECIQLYRSLPALWKVTSKEYSDRQKKNYAYEVLLTKYKERYPEASKDTVRKKFNSLRTNFRKEVKKLIIQKNREWVQKTYTNQHCGISMSSRFLMEDEVTTHSLSTVSIKREEDEEQEQNITTEKEVQDGNTTDSVPLYEKNSVPIPAKKTRIVRNDELLNLSCEHLGRQPDEYDSLAVTWVNDLKQMAPNQALFARKAINDILVEGRLGTLHRHSVQINTPYASSTPLYTSLTPPPYLTPTSQVSTQNMYGQPSLSRE